MPDEADPEQLWMAARALARCSTRLAPADMVARAHAVLTDCEVLAAASPRSTLRRGDHRAAAAAALVAASACVRRGESMGQWARVVGEHAQLAGDGPLLAELWLTRAEEEGAAAHARDGGSPGALHHVLAAQSVAGPSAFARCWAHLALANEWALDNEGHGALLELDCAAADADHALPSPFAVPVDDVGAWFTSGRGAVLRKLGRWDEAAVALHLAPSRGPVSDVYMAVEWARLRAATGDVDAAATYLMSAAGPAAVSGSLAAFPSSSPPPVLSPPPLALVS
jgi:hypothetical protein